MSVLGERLSSGFAVFDPQGRLTYANDALCRLLQYPSALLVDATTSDRPPYDVTEYRNLLTRPGRQPCGTVMAWRNYTDCELRLVVWPFPMFEASGQSVGSFALIEPSSPGPSRQASSSLDDAPSLAGNTFRQEFGQRLGKELGTPALSPREREILHALVEGQSLEQAAAAFQISPHTVRNHRKRIYRKLDIRSEAELLRLLFLGRPRADA